MKHYINFVFIFSLLFLSFNSRAEMFINSTLCYINSGAYSTPESMISGATSSERCSGGRNGYQTNGSAFISGKSLVVPIILYHYSKGPILTQTTVPFTVGDDCYATGSSFVCGLVCNSESTCISYSVETCGAARVVNWEFPDPLNWRFDCQSIESPPPPDGSGAGQSGSLTEATAFYRGSNGAKGADGVNGIDGEKGADGIDGEKGADGIDGEKGADGANGEKGADGSNGIDGTNGTNGIDGLNGSNGSNGINGINGRDGSNGTNGIDGIDGTNGTNGIDGSQGIAGIDGSQGSQGVQGIQGIQGLKGDKLRFSDLTDSEKLSLKGVEGGSCSLSNNGTLEWSINCEGGGIADIDLFSVWQEWKDSQCRVIHVSPDEAIVTWDCPDGIRTVSERGADGTDGIDGEKGADGIAGIDGEKGADGIAGIDGEKGADGIAGIDGKKGADGVNGVDGRDGINGTNGVDGRDGTNGLDGIQGIAGLNGLDGENVDTQAVVDAINDNSAKNVSGSFVVRDNSIFNSLFDENALLALDSAITNAKTLYRQNLIDHKSELLLAFQLSPSSSGYKSNSLVIKNQSYDISWSRFSEYFPAIGTIVFALAGFIALSILFRGRF